MNEHFLNWIEKRIKSIGHSLYLLHGEFPTKKGEIADLKAEIRTLRNVRRNYIRFESGNVKNEQD